MGFLKLLFLAGVGVAFGFNLYSQTWIRNDACVLVYAPQLDREARLERSGQVEIISQNELERMFLEYASLSKILLLVLVQELEKEDAGLLSRQMEIQRGKTSSLLSLLEHTSGIQDRTLAPNEFARLPDPQHLNSFFVVHADNAFRYSNLGYVLAGRQLSASFQVSYRDLLSDRLLRPAGLKSITTKESILGREIRPLFRESRLPARNHLFLPAFGWVGNPLDLVRLGKLIDPESGVCFLEYCIKGAALAGGFYFEGRLDSGATLLYLSKKTGPIVLASDSPDVELKGRLRLFLAENEQRHRLQLVRGSVLSKMEEQDR